MSSARTIAFGIPGDLTAPTGGYVYARRIMAEWAKAGVPHRVIKLPGAYPNPTHANLNATAMALALADAPLLIDGLAYGAFSEVVAKAVGWRTTVLLHHPLCDETGLSDEAAATAFGRERIALSKAAHVVVTSPLTARDLTVRFGVDPDKITIAEPGLDQIDPADPAPLDGNPPVIIAVGSVTPRKGYADLVTALAACTDIPWRCEIIGALDRDTGEAARVQALIAANSLTDRITLRGALTAEQMTNAYTTADLLAAPSLHEGYGMAVAEAMAHGLPIIAAKAGALPETAPAARFVPPADAAALATALREILTNADLRNSMGAQSLAHARTRPNWQDTARRVAGSMGVMM